MNLDEHHYIEDAKPASKSSFSRPVIRLTSTISPVPRAALRRTSARVVVAFSGRFPLSLALAAAFENTCQGQLERDL